MKTYLKFLFVLVAFTAMFSSCKKTTDTSILEGHKWVLSTASETYSDSGSISHNLNPTNPLCQTSAYTEFHDYTANDPLRLQYTYSTTNCAGAITTPSVALSSWNIDPDNTVLYIGGNLNDGTGGNWFTIVTLTSSSLVYSNVFQSSIGSSGPPNFTPIYHTVTDTYTMTVK
jgi:hypothetical protein